MVRPNAAILRKGSAKTAKSKPRVSSRAFLTLPETPRAEVTPHDVETMDTNSDDAPLPPPHFSQATEPSDFDGIPTPSSPVSAGSKRASSPARSSSPPPKRSKGLDPQFREGFVAGGVSKADDYEDVVKAIILRACLEYSARICGINAFPTVSESVTWAKDCWKAACTAAEKNYNATERIIKLFRHFIDFTFFIIDV